MKKLFLILVFASFCYAGQSINDTVVTSDSTVTYEKEYFDLQTAKQIKEVVIYHIKNKKIEVKETKKFYLKKGHCDPDTWEEESK